MSKISYSAIIIANSSLLVEFISFLLDLGKNVVRVDNIMDFPYYFYMGTVTIFLLSLVCGYYLSLIISHPKRKHRILPQLKFKNFEISPNVRLHLGGKTYWFHHWVYLSVLIAVLFIAYDSFQHFMLLKGAALGGVFQGLRYPDRFKFRHPRIHS